MALDLEALLAHLREREATRTELRRLLLGDTPDLLQALTDLTHASERVEQRLEALAVRIDALAAAQQRTDERLAQLAAAQQRTDERLAVLADRVGDLSEQMAQLTQEMRALTKRMDDVIIRADRAHGYLVERRYGEKGYAYFARIARRLKPLGPEEVHDLLDRAGLSEEAADDVRYADAIFAGRLRTDDNDGYLIVETSVTIGHEDVDRAHKRAFALQVKGVNAVPVVAGEQVSELVSMAARRLGVWQVTNGVVIPPGDSDPDPVAASAN